MSFDEDRTQCSESMIDVRTLVRQVSVRGSEQCAVTYRRVSTMRSSTPNPGRSTPQECLAIKPRHTYFPRGGSGVVVLVIGGWLRSLRGRSSSSRLGVCFFDHETQRLFLAGSSSCVRFMVEGSHSRESWFTSSTRIGVLGVTGGCTCFAA